MQKTTILLIILAAAFFVLAGCTDINDGRAEAGQDKPAVEEPTIPKDPVLEQVNSMTLDEKIGQMVIAGLEGYSMNDDTLKMIKNHKVGGFILYGSNIEGPEQLLELINSLKTENSANSIPLFIAVDEEGGRVSRMPQGLKKLPASQAIGNTGDETLSYKIGSVIAMQLKEFGFNMNFAPVLDINSNPENPVIGDRSFGAEEDVVSRMGAEAMKGIQAGGIIPVVKHFPGHGDTSVDSHKSLPRVNSDLKRLRSFELLPFKRAVNEGADAVMTAHILLHKIDPENPATLSKDIITGILREQMQFEGVVITDDMTMGAIVNGYDIGEASVKSINAGSDIILAAHGYDNAEAVINALKEAAEKGKITMDRIDGSVYRILKLKSKYKLDNSIKNTVDIDKINKEIHTVLSEHFGK